MTLNFQVLRLCVFFNSLIAHIAKDTRFLTVQQINRFGDVMCFGRRTLNQMNEAGVSICSNMRLYAKEQLVSLLGLVHLRVTLARVVLGRCGRINQSRVNQCSGLELIRQVTYIDPETGKTLEFRRAQHKVKDFICLDQFLALSFAQLTARESLRDIEINLRVQRQHFYHLGFRCKTISRNTLANANRVRPWEVFADLAHHLIGVARPLYANDATSTDLKSLMGATVYALDATTIDLCLSLFSWAPFRTTKAAIKLHTLMDLRGSIPSFIHISDGKMHDVKVLDLFAKQGYIEVGAYYVMDKAYVDFARLHQLHIARAFFVTRAKNNMKFVVVQEFPVPINTGLSAISTFS